MHRHGAAIGMPLQGQGDGSRQTELERPRKKPMPVRSGERLPTFSLVLPAYNPGLDVLDKLRELQQFIAESSRHWEVIFVCDGCTDGTPGRLRALTESNDTQVRVLEYSPNRGKGYAVRLGLQAGRGRHRIFTDVDLAYGFDDIERIAQALESGAPVAIASRDHRDSRLLLPTRLLAYAYRRYWKSQVFSWLARAILPLHQIDTQAGLKGMSAEIAELIVPRLSSDGFELDCELLTACVRLGVAVTEVPVCVRLHNSASTTGLRATAKMASALWRIRKAWPAQSKKVMHPAASERRAA
jgi:dolichyl-phosphate beta-glucosyltransferase